MVDRLFDLAAWLILSAYIALMIWLAARPQR
jgi:hypothetical protein